MGELIVRFIELLSIVVLIFGLILNFKNMILAIFNKDIDKIMIVKNKIGVVVLLGLEIFIIADIIETSLNPNWEDISFLAIIVIIRTITSYFLNKELNEDNQRVENK